MGCCFFFCCHVGSAAHSVSANNSCSPPSAFPVCVEAFCARKLFKDCDECCRYTQSFLISSSDKSFAGYEETLYTSNFGLTMADTGNTILGHPVFVPYAARLTPTCFDSNCACVLTHVRFAATQWCLTVRKRGWDSLRAPGCAPSTARWSAVPVAT